LTAGPTAVRALPGWPDGRDLALPLDGPVAAGLEAADPVAAGLAAADPAAGIVTMLTGAGRVWNSSTPMRPATVAVITIGVRLTAPGFR
jgi:hypothetical protein